MRDPKTVQDQLLETRDHAANLGLEAARSGTGGLEEMIQLSTLALLVAVADKLLSMPVQCGAVRVDAGPWMNGLSPELFPCTLRLGHSGDHRDVDMDRWS